MIKNKLLGIDYGIKKTGISISDINNRIAVGLICIDTNKLFLFLKDIIKKEGVNIIIIGLPDKNNYKNQYIINKITNLKYKILKFYPNLIINFVNERYTSKLSTYYLKKIKYPKKKIKEEENIISAILILQSYLKKKKI